jgi:hypothetical protein
MPLTWLNLFGCPVEDLEPIRGMRLNHLVIGGTQLRDLTLLEGMPLNWLNLYGCGQVQDLTPLRGKPLKYLQLGRTGVTDLEPLQGMPLEEIYLTPSNITRGLDALRAMKSVERIGVDDKSAQRAEEFWERYDKGEFK